MEQWYALEQIVHSTVLTDDIDAVIRKYNTSGVYSTSSLYKIINFRGILPIYVPAIWSLTAPPKIHIYLWLVSKNKIMTKYNLLKRHISKNPACVFCSETETVHHLFFDCIG